MQGGQGPLCGGSPKSDFQRQGMRGSQKKVVLHKKGGGFTSQRA